MIHCHMELGVLRMKKMTQRLPDIEIRLQVTCGNNTQ